MKANPRPLADRHSAAPSGLAGCVVMVLALAGCAAPQAPTPPRPAALPAPSATIARPAEPADWRDRKLTDGSWTWADNRGTSTATFGQGAAKAQLSCPRGSRVVTLFIAVPNNAPGNEIMAITTTSTTRQITPQSVAGGYSASFASTDRLLDAMAFTRGRLMVEVGGWPARILPADPTIARVVEDCRKG